MSAIEISNMRLGLGWIVRLPSESTQCKWLLHANDVALVPCKLDDVLAPPQSLSTSTTPEEEPESQISEVNNDTGAMMNDDELRDWFGILIDSPPPSTDSPVEEDTFLERDPFWDEPDPVTGFTPEQQAFRVCASNAIVHRYVTSQNMLRMLSAMKDSWGYFIQ
jgi:hypothetical protein